jgi:O-antigen/teichoic acid export membrane protein
MFKILKSSVRDTFIYSIGTFASKLAGFILVPLYTNKDYLSEVDYGVLNLLEANLQFTISVFGLGLCYAYERWYWDKDHLDKRNSIFFSILLVTACLSILLVIGLSPFAGFFSDILFKSPNHAFVLQLMLLTAGLEIISQTPNSLIRLKERPTLFSIANVMKLTVSIIFTVIFTTQFHLGLEGVYYAQIIGLLVYFTILSKFLLTHITFRFEGKAVVDMIRFRFPFLLPIIALNIFSFNDRFVISNLYGVVDAGIYSLGAKLANTIKTFVITAIWLALTPTIYKMMNDPSHKRFYSKVMTYLGFTIIILVMFFSFFSKELVSLFATEQIYIAAYQVIPLTSLGIFFGLLKDVSLIGLNITKKTRSIAFTTILVSAINLLLNMVLVKYLGMMGAAVAGLVAQLLFFLIVYRIAQRHYNIPYEIKKIVLMILLSIGLYGLSCLSNSLPWWIKFPCKLLLIASFPFLLYCFGFYEAVELKRIKGFWDKWKNPLSWKKNLMSLNF